jgi:hypothetical protein
MTPPSESGDFAVPKNESIKKSKTELEQLNETGRRSNSERGSSKKIKQERRRLIDPTTCERDYDEQEIEFMQAMDDYKRRSGRMFPTCSEILEVFRSLGYQKVRSDASVLSETPPTNTARPSFPQLQLGSLDTLDIV